MVNVQIFDDFCCDCKVSHYGPYHLYSLLKKTHNMLIKIKEKENH